MRCLFYLLSQDIQWLGRARADGPKTQFAECPRQAPGPRGLAREAPAGAIDPFILAFEDKDERVRTRAQQLIEQDWARRAEEEKRGERGER